VFRISDEIRHVSFGYRTVWVWMLTVNLVSPCPGTAASFEVRGFGTSLDSAHAEMRWAIKLTELKLRLMGFTPAE